MTKLVKEVVEDIRANPSSWTATNTLRGVMKGGIMVDNFGNTRMLSVIHLYINGENFRAMTGTDKFKLESVVMWWYKQCPLEHIMKRKE